MTDNKHSFVVGTTRTGKSQSMMRLLNAASSTGNRIIIIDTKFDARLHAEDSDNG